MPTLLRPEGGVATACRFDTWQIIHKNFFFDKLQKILLRKSEDFFCRKIYLSVENVFGKIFGGD